MARQATGHSAYAVRKLRLAQEWRETFNGWDGPAYGGGYKAISRGARGWQPDPSSLERHPILSLHYTATSLYTKHYPQQRGHQREKPVLLSTDDFGDAYA